MKIEDIGNKDVVGKAREGLLLRHRAAQLENEAKECKEQGKQILLSVIHFSTDRTLEMDGVGKAIYNPPYEKKGIDMDAFKKALMDNGVSVSVIAYAEKHATVVTEVGENIRFMVAKGGKG